MWWWWVVVGVLETVPPHVGPRTVLERGTRSPPTGVSQQAWPARRHNTTGWWYQWTRVADWLTNLPKKHPKPGWAWYWIEWGRNVFPTYQDRRHGHPKKQEYRVWYGLVISKGVAYWLVIAKHTPFKGGPHFLHHKYAASHWKIRRVHVAHQGERNTTLPSITLGGGGSAPTSGARNHTGGHTTLH